VANETAYEKDVKFARDESGEGNPWPISIGWKTRGIGSQLCREKKFEMLEKEPSNISVALESEELLVQHSRLAYNRRSISNYGLTADLPKGYRLAGSCQAGPTNENRQEVALRIS
jgi:hypothetical protein